MEISNKCKDCVYFRQHYYLRFGCYFKTNCGCCTKRRFKDLSKVTSCETWEKADTELSHDREVHLMLLKLELDIRELRGILAESDGVHR